MLTLLGEIHSNYDISVVESDEVVHALKVRAAVATNDYIAFFRLLETAPRMSFYLMQYLVSAVRFSALKTMMKVYKPTVELEFVTDSIGFRGDCEVGRGYVLEAGAKLTEGGKQIDTRVNEALMVPADAEDNLI